MDQQKLKSFLNRMSNVMSGVTALFLIIFVGAYVINPEEDTWQFESTRELIEFVLFPCLTGVGLALNIKPGWLGAAISLLAMAVFWMLRPDLFLQAALWVFVLPGILRFAAMAIKD